MQVEQTANETKLALIERARRGDHEAFAELVLGSRRRVFAAIGRLIARREDIEDVAQDAFIRLYTSLPQLRTAEAFDFWLYRLTVNAVYDYLRKRPRNREVRLSELEDQQLSAATASACYQQMRDEEQRRRVLDQVDGLLANLSASDRILIVLREVEGLSMKELSSVLSVSEGAVKLRLFRARNRLRKFIHPEPENPAVETATEWAHQEF